MWSGRSPGAPAESVRRTSTRSSTGRPRTCAASSARTRTRRGPIEGRGGAHETKPSGQTTANLGRSAADPPWASKKHSPQRTAAEHPAVERKAARPRMGPDRKRLGQWREKPHGERPASGLPAPLPRAPCPVADCFDLPEERLHASLVPSDGPGRLDLCGTPAVSGDGYGSGAGRIRLRIRRTSSRRGGASRTPASRSGRRHHPCCRTARGSARSSRQWRC